MGFQDDPNVIQWHLHLNRPPHEVYEMLSTDDGRAQFWAEEAIETRGVIGFLFPNGARWRGEILEEMSPHRFSVRYYRGSTATFTLKEDGSGGTDLALTDQGVDPEHRSEVIAGWVSVLMTLKAAVEYSVDLRNHDPDRSWDEGYVEN